jgi:hypothetical protein
MACYVIGSIILVIVDWWYCDRLKTKTKPPYDFTHDFSIRYYGGLETKVKPPLSTKQEEQKEREKQDKEDIKIIMDIISTILDEDGELSGNLASRLNQLPLPAIKDHLMEVVVDSTTRQSRLSLRRQMIGGQFQKLEDKLRKAKQQNKHLNMKEAIRNEEKKQDSILFRLHKSLERWHDKIKNISTDTDIKKSAAEDIMTALGDIAYYRHMKTNFLAQFTTKTTNCNVS